MVHRFFLHAFALALCVSPVACDDEESDTGNETGHDDHDDHDDHDHGDEHGDEHDDEHEDEGHDDGSETTSSEQTCVSMHLCENDVCVCTTPGKEDESCTDDEACSDECEVCS